MSASRMSLRPSTGGGPRVTKELFQDRVAQIAAETVESLQNIWHEAGYEDIECQSLLGDLLNKVKMTCASELAAEQQILEHAKQQVSSKLFEYTDFCAQLGRPPPPGDIPRGANYTDKLAELEKLLSSISGEVSQRQKLLNTEETAIHELVTTLGEEAPSEDAFQGPAGTPHLSDIRLELMRAYKKTLVSTKTKRLNEMTEVARICVQNMNDMVISEEGSESMASAEVYRDFDAALLQFGNTGALTIPLFQENLELLQKRCESLVAEKERRREDLAASGAEIARLWTLLRIPQEEREAFQNSFKMNLSLETLEKGRKELERLNLVRKESLGRVVSSIRSDIAELWDEAGIESDEQRSEEFSDFFLPVGELNDSSVEVHEGYYSSLRARVEELRPLLSEIQRREIIVQERVELEHLQMNPERLSARGPHAREERKREEGMNARVRNLEKITKKVLHLITKWEENNGPFFFAGERYPDRVELQEVEYQETKQNLRNSRKKKEDVGKPGQPKVTKRASTAASKISSSGYGQRSLTNKENASDRNSTASDVTEISGR